MLPKLAHQPTTDVHRAPSVACYYTILAMNPAPRADSRLMLAKLKLNDFSLDS